MDGFFIMIGLGFLGLCIENGLLYIAGKKK